MKRIKIILKKKLQQSPSIANERKIWNETMAKQHSTVPTERKKRRKKKKRLYLCVCTFVVVININAQLKFQITKEREREKKYVFESKWEREENK